jgi:hypothetical protein
MIVGFICFFEYKLFWGDGGLHWVAGNLVFGEWFEYWIITWFWVNCDVLDCFLIIIMFKSVVFGQNFKKEFNFAPIFNLFLVTFLPRIQKSL